MKPEILIQIQRLGGNVDHVKGNSLQEDLQLIEFKNPLYPKDYGDNLYGADEFYDNNKQLYVDNKRSFLTAFVSHFFSDHEIPYGQSFFRNFTFTPFRPGTKDFEELDGLVQESEIREVVDGKELDFICICYSYSYPDHYFLCLTDPKQENPTVYGTDHETYFQEIKNEGLLEDFFKRFLTKAEFLAIVDNYFENSKTSK